MKPKDKKRVLVALSISQHFYYKGVARYAAEHGWHLVSNMIYTGKIPVGWKGDGILTFLGLRNDLVDFVLHSHVPAVDISLMRDDVDIPRVIGDNHMIGRLAAEHFLERDYKHFAWAPFRSDTVNRQRFEGFENTISAKGFHCHVLPCSQNKDDKTENWTARRKDILRSIRKLPRPLAVFAYNDYIAADIIDTCLEGGLHVPEEVAVMGVDNDPYICECAHIPLSSVIADLEGYAYQAAVLLDQLMHGHSSAKQMEKIPPKGVVTRTSTDIMAVDNLVVARALRFIAENYHRSISVEDVISHVCVSRRPLEKAFRKTLNGTIHGEIVNYRLEKVKDLLINTDSTICDISEQTGFTRPNHLFRTFRKMMGTSPNEYRTQNR
ncbi:substrate-binding domain-containing protein [Planctomycetota bacterium]